MRLPSASLSFLCRLSELAVLVPFEFQPLVSQFKKCKLNYYPGWRAVEPALRACYVDRGRPGVAELADAPDSKSGGT